MGNRARRKRQRQKERRKQRRERRLIARVEQQMVSPPAAPRSWDEQAVRTLATSAGVLRHKA
jgi:hypothetical protein